MARHRVYVRDCATGALFASYLDLLRWRRRTGSADRGEYTVRASQVETERVYGPDAPAALAAGGEA